MNDTIQSSTIFRAVYEFWDKLRQDGEMVPNRDRFNPMALAPVLPDVVLVERVSRGHYEYRVAGTAVSERIKANPVGYNMLEYFVPEVRTFLTDWFEAMTFHPCATLTRTDLVFQKDPDRAVRVLGLPLKGKGGQGDYYLFGNEAWRPKISDNLGNIVSAGEYFLECQGLDIGAGIPDLVNVPGR